MKQPTILLLLVALPVITYAQSFEFVEQPVRTVDGDVPFIGVTYSSIAFADIDGDNDLDLMVTGSTWDLTKVAKLYKNDGKGQFTEVNNTPFVGTAQSSIAFADIDGDNDLDLMITGADNSTSTAKLYTNDGKGQFTKVNNTPFVEVASGSIAFADVDGDNDQDLMITGKSTFSGDIAKLYTNDGKGTFTEVNDTHFEGVHFSSIAFADIDGDNDLDLMITGAGKQRLVAKLYSNDGKGAFTEVDKTPFTGVYGSSIAFADVDGDSDLDLMITGSTSEMMTLAKLYTNDGTGTFAEVNNTPFSAMPLQDLANSSIAFTDVDGDNDLDLMITGIPFIARLYTNDGKGMFTEVDNTPFGGVENSSIAFADIDGDNDQDLVISGLTKDIVQITNLYKNTLFTSASVPLSDEDVQLALVPNPATSGDVILSLDATSTSPLSLEVTDILGRSIIAQTNTLVEGHNAIPIDCSTLPSGVYIVQIQLHGTTITRTLVLE